VRACVRACVCVCVCVCREREREREIENFLNHKLIITYDITYYYLLLLDLLLFLLTRLTILKCLANFLSHNT